ncbi:MAG: ribonuclease Z [Candidatus Micrarchaeaceae archaeon]
MTRVTFLGTSGSIPTKDRSLSTVAIEYNKDLLLFDCGEGAQRQMMIYGVNLYKISSIFLSHMHADHVIGIVGLVRTLEISGRKKSLNVFVPAGQEEELKKLLGNGDMPSSYKLAIKGIRAGKIFSDDNYSVEAIKLNHSIKVYGFVFKENERVRFIKDKCARLGIKGKMFSELQKAGSISLNGASIALEDVTYRQKGIKLAYLPDTRPLSKNSKGMESISGADILIHESTYSNSLRKLAIERKHSTSIEAANVAKLAGAKKLILFHMSARYRDASLLENEAREIFPDTVAAYDGMKLNI